MINVQIVDEHPLFTDGLCAIIQRSGVARVSAVYYNLASCRQGLQADTPDILLLDIGLPDGNGVDFCAEAKALYPTLKIMMVTTYNEFSIVNRSLRNGALGYVVKNALSEELITGIQTVADDELFLCREVKTLVRRKRDDDVIWLANKERDVLLLIDKGYTNAQIASALCVSPDTVKGYRKDLLRKFNVNKSILMVAIAKEQKLI
jgi:DNA-binding NarL/FixJ family response regulator